ncbi:hypothetical protein B4U37_19655 [Sutcliffiella horikoshii]|uniref:Cthe-2314-like HEPN domain-containing protein n=1 Tax=Sutcliffiella horikoshii TaxID=79883 RepID=A0ABN4ZI07_9BACI|nr:hypothetical protein [Sutcliffiella horikoshii]ART78117.1 hypothetical protein B4U37_19655 [Sutcliffiella horikoshii]
MKLNFPCTTCFLNGRKNIESAIDITDDGVYEVKCENGHYSIQLIRNEKYEILFDLGMLALNNGFAREAVSSLASSLERFYEYATRVILNGFDIGAEEVEKTWKLVSNQSERQLGAFYFMYLSMFKEVPTSFPNKKTSFRNNVIHKGYIPTEKEVFEYADEIYNYIVKFTLNLKERLSESMEELFQERLNIIEEKFGRDVSTPSYGTILDKSRPITVLAESSLAKEYEYVKAEYLMYSK